MTFNPQIFIDAAQEVDKRNGIDHPCSATFSCLAITAQDGNVYDARRFYEELYDCEDETFKTKYTRLREDERIYMREGDNIMYDEDWRKLREIRVMALLFAYEIALEQETWWQKLCRWLEERVSS